MKLLLELVEQVQQQAQLSVVLQEILLALN
jgi:hypothetical protein